MATNGQLRRAIKHARRNGWQSHWDGSLGIASRRGPRSISVSWDVLHRNVVRVIERSPECHGAPRGISIRRAIAVLTTEYDRDGNPIA